MLNKEQNDEECDATDDDSSNAAGPIIFIKATEDKIKKDIPVRDVF
jgi:hypothetical protein